MPFFAITISPKPVDVPVIDLIDIYNRHYISKIRVEYVLYPETDLKGRLHFHGIIKRDSSNIKDYLWSIKMLENWCFICIKEINNATKWDKYCRKEWKLTKKLLKLKRPLTYSMNTNNEMTLFDYEGFIMT